MLNRDKAYGTVHSDRDGAAFEQPVNKISLLFAVDGSVIADHPVYNKAQKEAAAAMAKEDEGKPLPDMASDSDDAVLKAWVRQENQMPFAKIRKIIQGKFGANPTNAKAAISLLLEEKVVTEEDVGA